MHRGPKLGAVVHVAQMTEFMHHYIVHDAAVEVHQPPVESNGTPGSGASPAGTGIGQSKAFVLHAQLGCKKIQAFGKITVGLQLEPQLHRAL